MRLRTLWIIAAALAAAALVYTTHDVDIHKNPPQRPVMPGEAEPVIDLGDEPPLVEFDVNTTQRP